MGRKAPTPPPYKPGDKVVRPAPPPTPPPPRISRMDYQSRCFCGGDFNLMKEEKPREEISD